MGRKIINLFFNPDINSDILRTFGLVKTSYFKLLYCITSLFNCFRSEYFEIFENKCAFLDQVSRQLFTLNKVMLIQIKDKRFHFEKS